MNQALHCFVVSFRLWHFIELSKAQSGPFKCTAASDRKVHGSDMCLPSHHWYLQRSGLWPKRRLPWVVWPQEPFSPPSPWLPSLGCPGTRKRCQPALPAWLRMCTSTHSHQVRSCIASWTPSCPGLHHPITSISSCVAMHPYKKIHHR